MKLPNFGWMTLRWMPICPSPAATATGLWATTQILPGDAVHLHREAHRRVDRPVPFGLEGGDDRAGDLVDPLARVVELEVGDRAGRAADRLPVHPADDAHQPLGPGEQAQDVLPLVVELGSPDRHEPHVVGPRVEAEAAEPLGVQNLRPRFLLDSAGAGSRSDVRRVLASSSPCSNPRHAVSGPTLMPRIQAQIGRKLSCIYNTRTRFSSRRLTGTSGSWLSESKP